jgi:metal iron transporter
MNCPSRPDNSNGREGWNQNPNLLSGTTREDFNGMANARVLRRIETNDPVSLKSNDEVPDAQRPRKNSAATRRLDTTLTSQSVEKKQVKFNIFRCHGPSGETSGSCLPSFFSNSRKVLVTFGKFVGPGFMVRTPLRVKETMLSIDYKIRGYLWLTDYRYP